MSSDWEGGERQPVRWRAIAVVVAVIGLVALLVANRDRGGLTVETGGQTEAAPVEPAEVEIVVQPAASAGDQWFCPNGFDVRAYDDGLAYPRNHPGAPPPDERPAACYRDLARAEAAGLRLAPPPSGTEELAGVYLRAPAPSVRLTCAGAAGMLGFAVPCPGLVPAVGVELRCGGRGATCDYEGGFILEQRGFLTPQGWCADCDGHLVFAASADGAQPQFASCFGGRTELGSGRRLEPAGRFELVECPPGPPWIPGGGGYPHERHTLATWSRDGVGYGVSIEGHGPAQQALVQRLVEAVELVAADVDPPGG